MFAFLSGVCYTEFTLKCRKEFFYGTEKDHCKTAGNS
jgi:hypothetical protein